MSPGEDQAPDRPSYAAYRMLLDAQRAALRTGNTRVLSDLTARASRMLDAMELPGHPPDDLDIREALTQAISARASVRELADRVRQERERLKLELAHARTDQQLRSEGQIDRRG